MPSLERTARRFLSTYQKVDGTIFEGTIFHADEGQVPSYDWANMRLLMRTPPDTPVVARDEIFDTFGRRFLVAEHGAGQLMDRRLYRVWRLIELTHQVTWTRATTSVDALSQETKKTGITSLGPIWVAMEPYGREMPDRMFKVSEQMHRVVTGQALQLNDLLDNKVVKRLDTVLGVLLAEIQ